MENKIICQICNKRKANKKLVSNIDSSFFIVCRKKKCITEIYQKFNDCVSTAVKNTKNPEETMKDIQLDVIDYPEVIYKPNKYNMIVFGFILGFLCFLGFLVFLAILLSFHLLL